MQLGCQTYTWEMLGDQSPDDAAAIVRAIGAAGYQGIEITNGILGDLVQRPGDFQALLDEAGLAFVAYTFTPPSGFTDEAQREADLQAIGDALDFVSQFPGTILTLGSPTDHHHRGSAAALDTAAAIFNAAGVEARLRGVTLAFHPSSHHDTALLTREHYSRFMALTDAETVGWVPDTGHILRGHQDVNETLSLFADRIRYVHLKDARKAGGWAMLGAGDAGIAATITHLRETLGFDGWLIAEEESDEAGRDPAAAVAKNQLWLQAQLG